MRVAFVCTGNTFTPDMLYKENYFIKASVKKGYETFVFANEYMYVDGKRSKVSEKKEKTEGYKLVRFPYKEYLHNKSITEKIRNCIDLTDRIIEFKPDYIFYNCPQVYNIKEIDRIKERLPETKITMDFSTKYVNSARNPLSKYVLHRVLYRKWLKHAEPFVDSITYVSPESREFIINEYDLSPEKMVENGLPAEVISEEDRFNNRCEIRGKYNIDDLLLIFKAKFVYAFSNSLSMLIS